MTRPSFWFEKSPGKAVAFTIHMALSLLVFSSLVVVMYLFWFPGDLFFIDGGWQGLKLVAMVDLVLGPALTLILYKPGKPKLVMDMSLIAAIQITALAYGFYTTHQQRTVAVVFAENGFNTLSASDNRVANQQLRDLDVEPGVLPPASLLTLPIMITPARDKESFGLYLQDLLNGFPGANERSDQYVPITTHHNLITRDALSSQQLAEIGALESVERAVAKRKRVASDLEFYRFKARYADGIAIFDPIDKRILDYISHTDVEATSDTRVDIAEDQSE